MEWDIGFYDNIPNRFLFKGEFMKIASFPHDGTPEESLWESF
jgi:hypothetical protein